MVREVQPLKRRLLMLVALGRLTVVRTLQFWKALVPMLVALGRFTVVRAIQSMKAPSPMVAASGRLTVVRAIQLEKALVPMVVAAGKLTVVRAVQALKALMPMVIMPVPPALVRAVKNLKVGALAVPALTLVAAVGRTRDTILFSPALLAPGWGSNSPAVAVIPAMVQSERSRETNLFAVCIAERRSVQPEPERSMPSARGTGSVALAPRESAVR
jgi:hypothetical protein